MNQQLATFIEFELARIKEKNPKFSLRAMAKRLSLPVSTLSDILLKKRIPNFDLVKKILPKLKLIGESEKQDLLSFYSDEQKWSDINKKSKQKSIHKSYNENTLKDDMWDLVSDYIHFAILNLIDTKDFINDNKWIAKTLNTRAKKIEKAIELLKRVQLLKEEDGILIKTKSEITTTYDIPNKAIKSYHSSMLVKANEALLSCPVEKRDISNVMMPIKSSRLPQAKELIRDFRRKLSAFLEDGNDKDALYSLNIQLFPLGEDHD